MAVVITGVLDHDQRHGAVRHDRTIQAQRTVYRELKAGEQGFIG